jgi:thiosulfate/3-mercaptopyruvate sulfurtransferase
MPIHRTLISPDELTAAAASQRAIVLDCSFDLADAQAGERGWRAGHLPGAQYAHLDRDLSGPKAVAGPRSPAFTGRHPLPERQAFAEQAGRWGITPGVQVVAYDGQGGPYAARAWWLLRWIGHDAVAVLDGGIAAWVASGGALVTDPPTTVPASPYPARGDTMPTVDAAALLRSLGRFRLIDARAGERFRGETEPLDPVAGHIPGAVQRFFKDNLQADGRFKPPAELLAEFSAIGAVAPGTPPQSVVHQCGSGVTACHNLLAMAHAGLEGTTLYPGSWSEWCADPRRPVAVG